MSKIFYPKLAISNIKKNGKFYFPYILTCIGTVAMFYIMCFIKTNEGINKMPGSESLRSMMNAGSVVIAIFSAIFLFYTNSFLIKRRKKELGLYNILGMEKHHIAIVMFYETVITGITSIISGLFTGILLSKLTFMAFFKLLSFKVPFGFSISVSGVYSSICLFSLIFLLILLSNLWQIKLAKPIELLRGGNVGEKEPKTKRIMATFGIICLGIGYYIALATESPLQAIMLFFVAVVLVIIGTYLLFSAGSIAILKMLRKNKKYYYQTRHFTSVSGMLYRMKQNAAGLASICILSTMVLVMVAGTLSLYLGAENAIDNRYPSDILIHRAFQDTNSNRSKILQSALDAVSAQGRTITKVTDYEYLSFAVVYNDGKFDTDRNNSSGGSGVEVLCLITANEYKYLTGKTADISGHNVLSHSSNRLLDQSFSLFGNTYTIKERLDSFPVSSDYAAFLLNVHFIVLSSDQLFSQIRDAQLAAYGDNASWPEYEISLNLDGTDEEKIICANAVDAAIMKIPEYTTENSSSNYRHQSYTESRQKKAEQFYALYGGFLFLGLFLGTLFMMATALIIYYKQISEGYDDKDRFEIMQKVGMSHDEIKSTVRSQVLKVFFLPIAAATIHIAAAFKMITKLLAVLNLTNVPLFFWCTVATVTAFAVIYGLVYTLTAKIYYKIVE